MAQFDVHRNKGALRDSIPYVVVVQSAQFDRYRRRVVVPLVRQTILPRNTHTVGARMNPVFVIKGTRVVLHPLDMVSVALDQLGDAVGSLAQEGQTITDALDECLLSFDNETEQGDIDAPESGRIRPCNPYKGRQE